MNGVSKLFACIAALCAGAVVASGGALVPPDGGVVPTMKSLDQIEPRMPLTQATTPGNLISVYAIRDSGSYYLTGDVLGEAGKHGIRIEADNVSLDLNGFAVRGVPGSLCGIACAEPSTHGVPGARSDIRPDPLDQSGEPDSENQGGSGTPLVTPRLAISNGLVLGWDGTGIDICTAAFARLEQLQVTSNGAEGIHVGNNAIVSRAHVTYNEKAGIHAGSYAIVSECSVIGNENGVCAGVGVNISRCNVRLSRANGILAGTDAVVASCMVAQSEGAGIDVGAGSLVTQSVSRSSGTFGIRTGANSLVGECVEMNSTGIGIRCGGHSLIRGNMSMSIDGCETSTLIENYSSIVN